VRPHNLLVPATFANFQLINVVICPKDYYSQNKDYYRAPGLNDGSLIVIGIRSNKLTSSNFDDQTRPYQKIQEVYPTLLKYNNIENWNPPSPDNDILIQGFLCHNGSGKYVVAENAGTGNHTKMILYEGKPNDDFNKLILKTSNHLYHNGSSHPIVAENGGSTNHTTLILYDENPSNFNRFDFSDGKLLHLGSGLHIVASNGDTANHTALILFKEEPTTFNTYKFEN